MKVYFPWDKNTQVIGAPIMEFDPVFPDVPIEERYTKEFLDGCINTTEERVEAEGIHSGMLYDPETDTFSEPPAPPEPEPQPEPEPEPVPPTPSAWDNLEAQVMYTALMTDTLIEDEQNKEE